MRESVRISESRRELARLRCESRREPARIGETTKSIYQIQNYIPKLYTLSKTIYQNYIPEPKLYTRSKTIYQNYISELKEQHNIE